MTARSPTLAALAAALTVLAGVQASALAGDRFEAGAPVAESAGSTTVPGPPPVERGLTPRTMTRHPNGREWVVGYFYGDKRVRDEQFDPAGHKLADVLYDGHTARTWQYHPSGAVAATFTQVDGKKTGEELRYDDQGHRIAVIPYRDGQRHGRQIEYLPTGEKRAVVDWKAGEPQGPMTTYYPTGEREGVVPVVDERKHGIEIQYFTDGRKKAAIPYAFGVEEGLAKVFDPDGRLIATVPYVHGQAHGLETRLYPNGKPQMTLPWVHGVRTGVGAAYDPEGRKRAEMTWKDGVQDGPEKRFDEEGRLAAVVDFTKGEPCCRIVTYYPASGRQRSERAWKQGAKEAEEVRWLDRPEAPVQMKAHVVFDPKTGEGRLEGPAEIFAESGKLWSRLTFKADLRDGTETRFDPKGHKVAQYQWKDDHFTGDAVTFWTNGVKQSEFPFEDGKGTGTETRWDDNGVKRMEIPLVQGRKHGIAKVYAKGKVVATLTFQDDAQTGEEVRFDAKGRPQWRYTWDHGKLVAATDGKGKAVPLSRLMGPEELAQVAPPDIAKAAEQQRIVDSARRDRTLRAAPRKAFRSAEVRRLDGPAKKGKEYVTFYPNGQVQSHYPANGNGLEVQLHPNGKERLVVPLLDGKRDGTARIYDETGSLWATILYQAGKKNGIEVHYARTGEKIGEYPYKDDKPTGIARTWYPDGSKQSEFHFSGQGEGTEVQYHRGGEVRLYVPLLNGKRQGVATIYTESGLRWSEMPFDHGVEHGTEVRFDREGRKIREIVWDHGKVVKDSEPASKAADARSPR